MTSPLERDSPSGQQPGVPAADSGLERRIRSATRGDVPHAAEMAAATFAAHPLGEALTPHREGRARILTGVLSLLISHAIEHGHVDLVLAPDQSMPGVPRPRSGPSRPAQGSGRGLTRKAAGDVLGIAAWTPWPERPIPDVGRRLQRAAGQDAVPFARYLSVSTAHHPSDRERPGGIHHSLALLAIRPGHQNCGHAGALLEQHHRILDPEATPAHVEAPGDLRAFFTRHGYQPHRRTVPFELIRRAEQGRPDPDDVTTLTPMWCSMYGKPQEDEVIDLRT